MENKLQKMYFTFYNLLIVQDLWQVCYQILSIIFLKKLMKATVNTDMMIKMECGLWNSIESMRLFS